MRKLKAGDVVFYAPEVSLCEEFSNKWGRGPFIVSEDTNNLTLTTLDGEFLMREPTIKWTHTGELLTKHKFLDFVSQAIKETNAKRTKTKAKPAARRGRAA